MHRQTLSSFGRNGCVASATLLLLLAAGSCGAGYWVFREVADGKGQVLHHALPRSDADDASAAGDGVDDDNAAQTAVRGGDGGARSTDLLDQAGQLLRHWLQR